MSSIKNDDDVSGSAVVCREEVRNQRERVIKLSVRCCRVRETTDDLSEQVRRGDDG